MPRACAALAVALAALTLASPAAARNRDAADTGAQILNPVIVTNPADMDFGRITPRGTAGTVVMTAAATPTCTTTGTLIRTGACRAARFDGDASFLFLLRVTKPAGGQINLVGPAGATMRLDNFSLGIGSGLFATTGGGANEQRYYVTNFAGNFTLYVGGTLNVAGNQRPGVYNGTFSVTFNYD